MTTPFIIGEEERRENREDGEVEKIRERKEGREETIGEYEG